MSAKNIILEYLLENDNVEIDREVLRKIAKVSDWARVVRGLREEGWKIETTRKGYILLSKEKEESLKERKPINKKLRYSILQRDNSKCQRCGKTPNDGVKLDIDHKIPKDWGGGDGISNLWTLCEECNEGKKNYYADFDIDVMKELINLGSGYARIKRFFEINENIIIEPSQFEIISQIRDWERTLRAVRKRGKMNIKWIKKTKENPTGGYIYESLK